MKQKTFLDAIAASLVGTSQVGLRLCRIVI